MRIVIIVPLLGVAILLSAIFTFVEYRVHKKKVASVGALFFKRLILVWYLLTIIFVLFKLEMIEPNTVIGTNRNINPLSGNYTPFTTIKLYWDSNNLVQIVGNFIVFMPLPILLYINFKKLNVLMAVLLSLLVSICIEPIQIFINIVASANINIIDVDDTILNSLGCLCGCLLLFFLWVFEKITQRLSKK